jgi:hypothetical protein
MVAFLHLKQKLLIRIVVVDCNTNKRKSFVIISYTLNCTLLGAKKKLYVNNTHC